MPFCPQCQDEFQDWVKICPDCGVELTEQLPRKTEQPPRKVELKALPERLVTVADYYFSPLAYLSKAKLESEGIQCFVFDEYIINANWLYLIAIGGVKLKVSESDAREAIRILQEVRDFVPGPAESPEDGCPKCRSSYIRYETFNLRWVFGVSAVSWLINPSFSTAFLLVFPFYKKKWKCNNCGYEWKDKKKLN